MIDDIRRVEERMSSLFATLERPTVTDLAFNWLDAKNMSIYPDPLPDLYAGEPLIFTARMTEDTNAISISGQVFGTSWTSSLPLTDAHSSEGIAKLWAHDRIDDLNNTVIEGSDSDYVERRVTDLALEFGLLTRHTSMVAVDVTPVRPIGEALTKTKIPTNLPYGWDYESVFGPDEQGLAPISMQQTVSLNVPQGATPAHLLIILGLIIFLVGVVILFLRRRTQLIA